MSSSSDLKLQQLIDWNQAGLIPGPNEEDQKFHHRVNVIDADSDWLRALFMPPFDYIEESSMNEATFLCKELFDFIPEQVPCVYSSKSLWPWEAGATWILEDDTRTYAAIQLHPSFKTGRHFFGLYQQKEVLAHELIHLARQGFTESNYEEFFAYQSSSSIFRKFLGPLFSSSRESVLFLFSCLLPLLSVFLGFILEIEIPIASTVLLFALPLSLFAFLGTRVWVLFRRYQKCIKQLSEICKSENKARYIAFRLSDQEISDFASWKSKKILTYIKEQVAISLRWRMITAAYLKNPNHTV
ncbi:MAG: hypothetical protein CMO81_04325 [Waddliaceae bacterium]|nr:hypothetical protein [Waddliaceae bacterium]